MKNICASTLLLAIVMSSFSFLFLPKGTVLADFDPNDLTDLFPANANSTGLDDEWPTGLYEGQTAGLLGTEFLGSRDLFITNNVTLSLSDVGSNWVDVNFGFTMAGGTNAAADRDGNTIIGDDIEDIGSWAAIYNTKDDGIPLESFSGAVYGSDRGMFLEIGTGTNEGGGALEGTDTPPLAPDLSDRFLKTKLDPFINFEATTQADTKIKIINNGLEPGQTYYARISFHSAGGTETGYSKFIKFTTDASGVDESATTGDTVELVSTGTTATENSDNGPECIRFNDLGVPTGINFPGCFANLLYYVFYKPTAFLAGLAAMFLDWFMHFSIQSSTYSESEFISQGWSLVRDISNIVFIFILLYIAIGTILRLPSVDAKKMIGTLVVVALLINFSLFFTKIVVDTSNILANLMYSTISVGGGDGVGDEKTISGALVSQFNPQTLFSKSEIDANNDIGMYIIVTLVAVVMNVLLIMMFLKIGILFVGRVISLMVAMIFSPMAFISMIVPGMKSWKNVGWSNWSSELIKTAFLAPVFLFFLYLIVLFLDLKTLAISDTASAGANLLYVLLPFAIVYTLLMKAEKLAIDLSGEIGQQSMSVMNKVGGFAVGAATGGAALAMRGTVGAYAARQAANPELQAAAAAGDKSAQRKLALANYGAASSFDFRKTKAGAAFGKNTGWDMDTKGSAKFAQNLGNMVGGTGRFDLSSEGGAKGANERKTKEKSDKADTYLLKGYEANQQDKKAGAWKADLEKALEEERKQNPNLDEVDFRKRFERGQTSTTYTDASGQVQTINGRAKEKTAKEVNSERLHDQANEVEYGNGYTQKRNEAREQALAQGQVFNEVEWRKAQNIEARTDMSRSEKQFTTDTRKKAGEENKPISGKEKKKAEDQLTRANYELKKIDQHLQDIADTWNLDPANAGNQITAADVSFDHVEFAMNEGQSSLAIYEAQLKKAEKDVADGTITAQQYAQVKSQYDKTKGEIASYKTLFNDKAQQQNNKSEAQEKLSS